jgi:hypothetical protein
MPPFHRAGSPSATTSRVVDVEPFPDNRTGSEYTPVVVPVLTATVTGTDPAVPASTVTNRRRASP